MSGPLDLSLAVAALIWYLSGFQTDRAVFWFGIFYTIGYTIAAEESQGGAAYMTHRNTRDFEEKSPCFKQAMQVMANSEAARATLGGGELRLARWPRSSTVEEAAGLARATFELRGDAGSALVVAGAKRRAAPERPGSAQEEDDEDEAQARGWRLYWAKPWELKAAVLSAVGRGTAAPSAATAAGAVEHVEEACWDVETLFFMPEGDTGAPVAVVGDPKALPEFEAMCVRRDGEAKGEKSRRRLRNVCGVVLAAAALASAARVLKSMRTSRSYGFASRSLLAHPEVARAVGSGASVQSTTGTFGSGFINARLRLVGKDVGAVADVDFAATREAGSWSVALARLRQGSTTVNLDRSHF